MRSLLWLRNSQRTAKLIILKNTDSKKANQATLLDADLIPARRSTGAEDYRELAAEIIRQEDRKR